MKTQKRYKDTRHLLRSTSLEEVIHLTGHRLQEWKKNCLRQIESADKNTYQFFRKDAHTATARCDRRMKQVYARTNPPSKYAVGEKVYVRLRGKGRLQKKRCVTEAVIEKRNLKRHLYKVSYTSPESRKKREVAGS